MFSKDPRHPEVFWLFSALFLVPIKYRQPLASPLPAAFLAQVTCRLKSQEPAQSGAEEPKVGSETFSGARWCLAAPKA